MSAENQSGAPGPHPLDQARLHRGAEHLHRLGPRAMAEFLAELGGRVGGGAAACLALLGEYGRLTPGQVRAAGGDRPLRPPLSVVPRRRRREDVRGGEPASRAAEPRAEALAFVAPAPPSLPAGAAKPARPSPVLTLLDRPSYRCRVCFFAETCAKARVLEPIRCPLLPRPRRMSKP